MLHLIRLLLISLLALLSGSAGLEAGAVFRGLPVRQHHSLGDVGEIPRGVTLGFDGWGRLALINEGAYYVLNDSTWIDLLAHRDNVPVPSMVVFASRERVYFGGVGAWGEMHPDEHGHWLPTPVSVSDAPAWVAANNFSQIEILSEGVLFAGWAGVVYWDRVRSRHAYFPLTGVSALFQLEGHAYVMTAYSGLMEFVPGDQPVLRPPIPNRPGSRLLGVALLRRKRAVLNATGLRLFQFDGKTLEPWGLDLPADAEHPITAMVSLPEGGVAVALKQRGLFLLTEEGAIESTLDFPEYDSIRSMACREPGVLWVTDEHGVDSIHYASPITQVDQRQGVDAVWPQVVSWQGRCLLSSRGLLYEALDPGAGRTVRFRLLTPQAAPEAWGIASSGGELMVANPRGLYRRCEDGRFEALLTDMDVARVVFLDEGHVMALGPSHIACLEKGVDGWKECTPRIPGVGYPSVARSSRWAAWLELGTNRVARISLEAGQLKARIFDSFSWKEPHWVNVSVLGSKVVLCGDGRHPLCFDETTQAFTELPEAVRKVVALGQPVLRYASNEEDTLWCSCESGLMRVSLRGAELEVDARYPAFMRDRTPQFWLMDADNIWVSTAFSLYHVSPRDEGGIAPAGCPQLVGIQDVGTGMSIPIPNGDSPRLLLGNRQRSLMLTFFSGSQARAQRGYEFRLGPEQGSWTSLASSSQIALQGLRDGHSTLEVRLAGQDPRVRETFTLAFEVTPPWHRSALGFWLYGLLLVLSVWFLINWTGRRERLQRQRLEALVRRRTEALEQAMDRLEEETRKNTIQAERNRIAGEMHDSLQQGLNGLMLQLGSTLRLQDLREDVRERLQVAQSMITSCRQELQSAIWDLESPLLDKGNLCDALRQMQAMAYTDGVTVKLQLEEVSGLLDEGTKHHLLRMAQEAFFNAIKYAAASTISISLKREERQVVLSIEDDGRGFDPVSSLRSPLPHFGLRGLKLRADKANAQLDISSRPGSGTRICICCPIAASPII